MRAPPSQEATSGAASRSSWPSWLCSVLSAFWMSASRVADCRLTAALRDARFDGERSAALAAPAGTTLTELFGVGPVVAAMVIGYTGDVRRFANGGDGAGALPSACTARR